MRRRLGAAAVAGLDDGRRVAVRPGQMEVRRRRRRNCAKDKRCDDSKIARAGATERPRQVSLVSVIAVDDATVRENDLSSKQVIRGGAVLSPEDPEPSSECQAGYPHRGT
jgi:hypothetical protein